MLREKNIESVDDNPKEGLKLEDLCNIECFYASNNKIKDLYGIGTLGSLLELNLNNNRICDMT
jgi:Leucine-rich repeat (LRR) protein